MHDIARQLESDGLDSQINWHRPIDRPDSS